MCNALTQVFEHGVCVFKHLYCSAQLSISNMEKHYRNKIIIIIIIIIIMCGSIFVMYIKNQIYYICRRLSLCNVVCKKTCFKQKRDSTYRTSLKSSLLHNQPSQTFWLFHATLQQNTKQNDGRSYAFP